MCKGRGRLGLGLLASSSLAALLVGGNAPAAFASCLIQNGGPVTSVSNGSATGNCIVVENGASVSGAVANTGALTANGGAPPSTTGITITNSTIGGTVTNSGTITANAQGILVQNSASVFGGISNSGTVSGSLYGVVVGGSSVSTTISTFAGGITNSNTILSANRAGIAVGGGLATGSQVITVSNFTGGISNNGLIAGSLTNGGAVAGPIGILVGGEAKTSQTITVSTFSGGITNSGEIGGSGYNVLVGGVAVTNSRVTVSSFGGGINNSGNIVSAGSVGAAVLVGGVAEGAASVTLSKFSGGITNSGTISATILDASGIFVGGSARTNATVTFSTFSGGITNSGTGMINAAQYGILVGVGATGHAQATFSTFSGGITNSGQINGGLAAILVGGVPEIGAPFTFSNFSGGISNSGTISGGFDGIFVGNANFATFSGGITNGAGGTISGDIHIGNLTTISIFSGGITNAGVISVQNGGDIQIGGLNNTVTISTFIGNISNSGTLSSAGFNSLGTADILVGGNSTIDGAIVDSGTIVASNQAIAIAVAATATVNASHTAIFVDGPTLIGAVNNAGTISAGVDGVGIAMVNVSTFAGGISNSGTISLSSGSTADGIFLSGVSTFSGGISNSGTITAAGYGLWLVNASTFSGGISNSGIISGGNDGIVLLGGISNFSGGISNSGTISAGAFFGVYVNGVSSFSGGIGNSGMISARTVDVYVGSVSTFTGNVSNSGTISAKTGIAVVGSTINGAIIDSGTVNGSSHGILINSNSKIVVSGSGTAVKVSGAAFSGGVTNAGAISVASGNGVLVGGLATGNVTITVSSFFGGVSNSGTISANGDGILVGGVAALSRGQAGTVNISSFAGGIGNSGTILASTNGIRIGGFAEGGTISISSFSGGVSNSGAISAGGDGILVGGTIGTVGISSFSGAISNSGAITGQNGIVIGYGVTFAGGGTIANSGTINGSVAAIDVSSATNATSIDLTAGLVSGAIKLSAHADVVNISGGTIAGNIVGAGSSNTINFNMGAGTFTYGSAFTGINQVNINSGTVVLNGADSATNVDVFGTLAGSGSIDPTVVTIHSGGTFSPGAAGVPGTSMTIAGNLAFQSGALYVVYLNNTATFANVSGTASLAGSVSANFASGSGFSKQYTILESSGLGGTTFSGLAVTGLPANFNASLSYSADDVYIDLAGSLPTGNFNVNQQNVANVLNSVFNSGGVLPSNFFNVFSLSGPALANALTALSGEPATDAQKGADQLMNDFLNLMLDPSAGGGGGISGGGANGFAPEQDTSLPADVALAYAKALNMPLKAPQPQSQTPESFDQRWTAWGSAFGGKSNTDGNAVVGSNNVTASDYGFAAGMDYHATPDTLYGFALAGGGTNWNLAQGLGSGRSDAFQAGVYAKTHWGPLYLSGALAFANHWFTTNRTAMDDQLRATFMGQSYAARGEVGYRYAVPITGAIVGVTPYAALQAQDFHTPSYSETDLTGGGFGLSYASMNATDTRSELGARFDNLQIINGMPLVLRGRLAWAHDWYTNATALNAVFQSLPGSNFTVNGAAPPKNSALMTAAAELHISANWTAVAKFDGAFGSGWQTYGGTGTLRYSW